MNINSLESNIWKYAIFLITNKRVYMTILSAYYLSIPETTTQDIGLILFWGSISRFIFEIPSGYFSDKIGHKQSLILSRVLMLLSTIFFLIAETFLPLVIGTILFAISFSFTTGTGSAFMHETLQGLGREDEYSKIMGKIKAIGFAVPIPLLVLTPFLVSIDFKAPFIIALIIDIIGLLVTISMVKPRTKQSHIEEINNKNFKQVIQEGYKLNFFQFALFTGLIGGIIISILSFRPAYQSFLEIPIMYYGIFFGIGRGLASIVLAYSGRIKNMFNIYSFSKFILIAYSLIILALGVTNNAFIVIGIFIFISVLHMGLLQVEEGFMLEIIKDSKFKATLLSMKSQIGAIANGVSAFFIGYIVLRTSYQESFLYLSFVFIAILLPIYIYMRKTNKFRTK